MIVGKIETWANTGREEFVATIRLQKDGHLVTFFFAETVEKAQAKAETWWEKYRSQYEDKIDKRKTASDPMAKLAKTLDDLTGLVERLEP